MKYKKTIIFLLSFIAIYGGLYLFFISKSPMPYKFMDFNKNGWVELSEAFTAMDIGVRYINKNNKTCTEYFYLKDGLEAYVDCEKNS